jgi:hypothetical protein
MNWRDRIEVWHHDAECHNADQPTLCHPYSADGVSDAGDKQQEECTGPGWYWWSCLPGCIPDGEPMGPFDTEEEALEDAKGDSEPSLEEAEGFADFLQELLEYVSDDCDAGLEAGSIHQVRIETYVEAGLLTKDTGLVVRFSDANGNRCKYQVTIQEDRR